MRGSTDAWLVGVDDDLASRLLALAHEPAPGTDADVRLETIARGEHLPERVATLRPRLVIVAEPPLEAAAVDSLLAERRHRSPVRIIHLTEPGAVNRRLRALDLGVDDALPLPITAAELLGRAHRLAARSRRRPDVAGLVPISADTSLDLIAHELRRAGTTIHLRPKEYRLLALLATHPGRVYTRRQLLDRVWGVDHLGDPRTVDVHVRWLRSKIEPDPEHPSQLVTVRGIGYRFDPTGR